jgi:hypothetical protein
MGKTKIKAGALCLLALGAMALVGCQHHGAVELSGWDDSTESADGSSQNSNQEASSEGSNPSVSSSEDVREGYSFNKENQPNEDQEAASHGLKLIIVHGEKLDNGFATLYGSQKGYARTVEAINGLVSVKVSYSGAGKLRLGYSYHDALTGENLDIWHRETGDGNVVELNSDTDIAPKNIGKARFLCFGSSEGDVNITSIVINVTPKEEIPSEAVLPDNLNKVFNASNRLNLALPAHDYTTTQLDYNADGLVESPNVIHLDQGKPTENYGTHSQTTHDDATVYNDWLAASGIGDISDLSVAEENVTSYAYGLAACMGYAGKAYRRTVNFVVDGADQDGVSNTILPSFVVNPYVSYDWGADPTGVTKIGDYNPFIGGELHIGDTSTDIAKQMFILQYDVNLTFRNVTFKGAEGVDLLYGWVGTSNSPESRTFSTSENQIENDMGTDLGQIKSLTLENCTFDIDSEKSFAAQAVDLKAFNGTKANSVTSQNVDITRCLRTKIDGCHFNKVHDASNQSSAIYTVGMNNVVVNNCTFGDEGYDGTTNTNSIDYNCFQNKGYTLSGSVGFTNNTIYNCLNRAIRMNTATLGSNLSFDIAGNTFTKGCKVAMTSGEGFGKFAALELAEMKAGIDHYRFSNDNKFFDNSGTLLTAEEANSHLVNAYLNYDAATKTHIAAA